MGLTEDFAVLFAGRADVYGTDEGGCVRQPVVYDTYRRHLYGQEPIGIYPLVALASGFFVGWGCTDIDVDDFNQAQNLALVFETLGMRPWIERSRSKGYHVWVFYDAWVPAEVSRHAFLAAHQAAGVPATEVNPKQVELAPGQVGNYVRLPYPGGAFDTPKRQVIINGGSELPCDGFVAAALRTRASLQALEEAASLYVPPQRSQVTIGETDTSLRQLIRYMRPLAYTIFEEGPLEGNDRSTTLFKLALQIKESDIDPAGCLRLLRDADARWGKFAGRPDCDEQLEKIIRRVYE